MTQTGRKRARACEDESCEFTPISKRINNLHIRSGFITSDDEGPDENGCGNSLQTKGCLPGHCDNLAKHPPPPQLDVESGALHQRGRDFCELNGAHSFQDGYMNGPSPILNPSNENDSFPCRNQVLPPNVSLPNGSIYNPELSAAANPHYYQINGLLYGLHINRLQRLGKLSSH